MPQEKLAAAAHVSVALVRAVEQGRTPASAAFTAGAAVALSLDVLRDRLDVLRDRLDALARLRFLDSEIEQTIARSATVRGARPACPIEQL